MDFLKAYGPWIISLAALVQFWIWLGLKRYGARGRVELYETASLEVGFDTNGPVIAVAGMIRSLDRQVFVKSMELSLTRDKDKARHEFRWMAFKPNFFLPLSGNRSWEMPGPFLVSPGDPHRFNVVFHDLRTFQEVKNLLHAYYQQWHETEKQILERKGRKAKPDEDAMPHDLIQEFKRKDICVGSYTELDKKCYWEQGGYAVSLKIVTEGATEDIVKHLRVNLNKSDAKMLKSNCIAMMEEPISAALGSSQPPYRVVQAEFSTATTP